VNKKDTNKQTFCIYKIDVRLRFVFQEEAHESSNVTLQDGLLSTNGDGYCPEKVNKEPCGATPRS
jgi:hypothetical protein